MTFRKFLMVVSVATAAAALSACAPIADDDNNYRGTVSNTGARASTFSTPSVPSVPAYPVTLTGSGEAVQTADLVATGYTITYQASSWTIAVQSVLADGSDGEVIVNAKGEDSSGGVTGTTTYAATGRTTFHVSNTRGPWTLTFTPLS